MNLTTGTGPRARRLAALLAAATLAAGCSSFQEPPRAGIAFTSEPTGAEVFIDGGYYGKTPTSVKLAVEHGYTVMFRRPGYHERAYRFNGTARSVHGVLEVTGLPPDSAAAADSTAANLAAGPATARGTIRSTEPEPPKEAKSIYFDKSAPVTVVLEGGAVLAAASVEQAAMGYVKVFLLDGTSKYISKHKIRSITTRTPADVTKAVLEGGRNVP